MRLSPKFFALATATLLLAVSMGVAQAYDPPLRVARLSFVEGNVSFNPAGERQWLRARRNRPHVRGDHFWTGDRSRAELQLGAAVVRMDERTSVGILNLDDRYAQFELTQGTLNLRVLRLYEGQTYEIATPTLAFVVSEPGEYRIDVDERGGWTEVVMWEGRAVAYGERSRFPLRAGDAIRFVEPTLRDYDVFRLPRADSFDRFCELRNERLERAVALRYVPDDLIGYSDLDEYGSWSSVREYGNVWFPTRVNAGWAPYRHGNWIWQDPWGWTWVDDSDWGFAPFHYGRWVQVDRRWGWIPSARRSRAVYAPALVAFLGTGRGYTGREPIGWFPLGPRDVYVPSYSASRDYFTRINSGYSTINVTVINNVYNSYSGGGRIPQRDFMYRANRDAVTTVPADVFVNSRPVRAAALPYDRSASAFSEATHIARMAPTVQSFTGNTQVSSSAPAREVLDRRVIARTAPPPAAVPFETRRQALGRTPGRPLDSAEMDTIRGQGRGRAADPAQQVRVVGAGTPVQRADNEARDATRQLERMGGADPETGAREGDFDRGRDTGEARGQRGRAPEPQPASPEAPAQGDETRSRGRERESAPPVQEQQVQRDAERQAEQAAREEQRRLEQAERERQRSAQEQAQGERQEAERQQREAERAQREAQQQREQAERAAGEERRAAQEAQQTQREQQRQQREAEAAQREQQRHQREAEVAQREQQRQQREAEAAQREQQRQQGEAETAQREQQRQQREAEQAERQARQAQEQQQAEAQREQERQQRDAERAQRQAEQEQQQAERAARQQQQEAQQAEAAQREVERQQRQAEQAARQAQQEQQQAERAQREQQQAAQQAEAAQRQAEREQQQAAQQAEAAQRQAEREQQEAERGQDPPAEEEDEQGKGKGRYKRDRDGG